MNRKTAIISGIISGVILPVILAGCRIRIPDLPKKGTWEKQELLEYCVRSGGNMNGNMNSVRLTVYGDDALLTVSEKEWYGQDAAVSEYLTDRKALEQIRKIVLDEGMYGWDGKKFSDAVAADGETVEYSFFFTEASVRFSSQIYPQRYRKKLEKLDAVIEGCRKHGKKLPGLVPRGDPEEADPGRQPEKGRLKLEVTGYSENRLSYRLSNETEDGIRTAGFYDLTDETGQVIATNRKLPGSPYRKLPLFIDFMDPGTKRESDIDLENRLEPGIYTLNVDDAVTTFEIR